MKSAPARPAASWLDAEANFRALAARVDRLVALQARLAEACPRIPLVVMSLEAATLTVATPNAAWAARLRQMAPTLLEVLRRDCAQVSRIRIVPQRRGAAPAPVASAPRPAVPPHALAELARLTAGIEASPLKQALANLIRHQRRAR